MARTTGTVSLFNMLERGVLREGERLFVRRRSAAPVEGVLQADGSIKVGRTVARSPSSAARIALGGGPVDGWLRWRVARLGEKNLAELRENQ